MNWKKLKDKYPEIWDEVYNSMIEDLCDCMSGGDIQQFHDQEGQPDKKKYGRIIRIAHNAAFFACDAVRKYSI